MQLSQPRRLTQGPCTAHLVEGHGAHVAEETQQAFDQAHPRAHLRVGPSIVTLMQGTELDLRFVGVALPHQVRGAFGAQAVGAPRVALSGDLGIQPRQQA